MFVKEFICSNFKIGGGGGGLGVVVHRSHPLLLKNLFTQGDIYPELEIWLLNRLRAQLKYRKTKFMAFVFRNTFFKKMHF